LRSTAPTKRTVDSGAELRNYGDTSHITWLRQLPVHSGKEAACARRPLGFPPRLLSSQTASHQVFESRHEVVRSERASGRLRGPKARQRDRLGLDVDRGGDAAEPIEQRRDRHEAIVTPARMRTKARPGQSCGRCTNRARDLR